MEIPVNLVIEIPDAEGRKLVTAAQGGIDDGWEERLKEILGHRITGQLNMSAYFHRAYAKVRIQQEDA